MLGARHASRAALTAACVLPLLLGVAPGPARADGAEPVPTTTELVISGGASYGEDAELVAHVASAAGTPSGTVTFSVDGGPVLAEGVPVDENGTASVVIDGNYVGPVRFRADFYGDDGFADSSDTEFWYWVRAYVDLEPEPTILRTSGPGGPLTLTMATYVRRLDGEPVAGRTVSFKIFGGRPDLFSTNGGTFVCAATTDARGFATCGGKVALSAALSLVAGGAWVSHPRFGGYEFAAARVPVVGPGAG